jgi:hypothetical protein
LESARKEIRELEQQLRRATRRLEEMERRQLRRNAAPRRPGNARSEPAPLERPAAPRAETAPPATPVRPAQPSTRRSPAPPRAPERENGGRSPRGSGAAPRSDYERRFRELDEKLNRLLKELERMKDDKKPSETSAPRPRSARPTSSGTPVAF